MPEMNMDLLIKIIVVAAIFLIGLLIIKIVLVVMKKALEKTRVNSVLHKFLLNAVKVILLIVLVLAVLAKLNIQTSSLITVLGVCGAAIALALKDSLANVAGGIMLLATKPFEQGDYIDINGTRGLVQHIDLLLTTLNTYDNKVITVPNGNVTTAVITNYSREDTRRIDMIFGIGYSDDINRAKDIMLALAETHPLVLSEPEPFTGVASHSESAVELEFRIWAKTEDYWEIKYFMEENVKMAFDEAGIEMPFPQMDVHIKK